MTTASSWCRQQWRCRRPMRPKRARRMKPTSAQSWLPARWGWTCTRVSRDTIRKWRQRDSVADRSHTAHRLQTTLNAAQEELVIHLRHGCCCRSDDLLAVVHEFIEPQMSRLGLDRLLRRRGNSRLPVAHRRRRAHTSRSKAYEPGLYPHRREVPAADGRRGVSALCVRGHRPGHTLGVHSDQESQDSGGPLVSQCGGQGCADEDQDAADRQRPRSSPTACLASEQKRNRVCTSSMRCAKRWASSIEHRAPIDPSRSRPRPAAWSSVSMAGCRRCCARTTYNSADDPCEDGCIASSGCATSICRRRRWITKPQCRRSNDGKPRILICLSNWLGIIRNPTVSA